jgi:IS605 OrfB family transposase
LIIPEDISVVDNTKMDYNSDILIEYFSKNIKNSKKWQIKEIKESLKREKNNINNRIKVDSKCGIDPGIRTFATIYSPNKSIKVGNNIKDKLQKYYNKIDKLNYKKSKILINNKNYTKTISRVTEKIKNKVKDMHWKLSSYLCKNYNKILIGKLSTRNILSNKTSNINSENKRALLSLSHYRFREILKIQGEKYNVEIIEIDERMTTKMCSNCKEIKNDVGRNKIYKCVKCGMIKDRDINSAINIYNKDNK